MMSAKSWKHLYQIGFLASLLMLGVALYPKLGPRSEGGIEASFRTTGQTASDVMRALAALGKADGVPTDPTSQLARHAIENAERRLGLPADGIADQALLDRLVGELEAETPSAAATGLWHRILDDGLKLSDIASALSTVLFGYLGLRRKT
jgi:hypothetical protein